MSAQQKDTNTIRLTDEQLDIIKTLESKDKVIKINAYAGTGKTASIVEVIKNIRKNDKTSKILYLVFNRSMIQEAKEKLADYNVECYTTHGFSLKRFTAVKKEDIQILSGLDFNIFMQIKNRRAFDKIFIRYFVINKMLEAYCLTFDNLDTFCYNLKRNNKSYNLENCQPKLKEIEFFKTIYEHFISENIFTHGMYLKEYSCNCADKIKYDYIFFDEAQDISMFALNIMKRMDYKKLFICGDIFQNIYSFLKTVNAFDKLDGKTMKLSTSFRFNKRIADLANKILASKYDHFKKDIKNFHNIEKTWSNTEKTILFRTNASLFEYAVELVKNKDNIKVKFMDIVSGDNCDRFDETFSEMIYFYYKLLESVKFARLKEFSDTFRVKRSKNIDEYVKIASKENKSLYRYLSQNPDILPLDLRKYFKFFTLNEHDIINVLRAVRDSENCENPSKTYILITSHRSKGLQFDDVKLAPDEWKINGDAELNLLYVAITRAKYNLDIRAIKHLLDEKGIFVDRYL